MRPVDIGTRGHIEFFQACISVPDTFISPGSRHLCFPGQACISVPDTFVSQTPLFHRIRDNERLRVVMKGPETRCFLVLSDTHGTYLVVKELSGFPRGSSQALQAVLKRV